MEITRLAAPAFLFVAMAGSAAFGDELATGPAQQSFVDTRRLQDFDETKRKRQTEAAQSKLKADILDLRRKLAAETEALRHLRSAHDRLGADAKAHALRLDAATSSQLAAERKLQEVSRERDQLRAEIAAQQKQAAAAMKKVERVASLELELERLRKQVANETAARRSAEKLHHSEIDKVRSRADKAENERDALAAQLKEAATAAQREQHLAADIEKKNAEIKSLQNKLERNRKRLATETENRKRAEAGATASRLTVSSTGPAKAKTAIGQVVQLKLKGRGMTISGALRSYDGSTYVIASDSLGSMLLDANRFECVSPNCPAKP